MRHFLPLISQFHFCSVKKLLSIRLFDDTVGKRWQRSIKDEQLEILCVSQFTLYGRVNKNKPDFHQAMQGAEASELYGFLLERLGNSYASEKIKGENWQPNVQRD